jgi:hypothetical protein
METVLHDGDGILVLPLQPGLESAREFLSMLTQERCYSSGLSKNRETYDY